MNKIKLTIHLIVAFLSLLTIYLSLNRLYGTGYYYVFVLPLAFLSSYFFILKLLRVDNGPRITTLIILLISFLRLVFIPFMGILSGIYSDTGLNSNYFIDKAILLLLYEHMVVCLFLLILYQKKISFQRPNKITQKGNSFIYIAFVLFAFFIYIFFGRELEIFEFVVKSVSENVRTGDVTDGKTLIIRQIIGSGFLFLFILTIEKIRIKFLKTQNKIYIFLGIIAALLLVSIIVGERRTSQVYVGFATAWTLIRIFPKEKRKIGLTIFLGAGFVIGMMTVYKHFNAFLYGSYISALQTSDLGQTITANTLDSYFYGINTISKNLEFASTTDVDFSVFLFDIYRNFFGLSFLFRNDSLTTIEYYNNSLYSGTQLSGYLFSSIAYGVIYYGIFFAPLITCFNIFISFLLEKILKTAKSIEMNYIVAYIFMRFAFGLYGHPSPLINFSTRFIIINGLVFLIARYFVILNKKNKYCKNA